MLDATAPLRANPLAVFRDVVVHDRQAVATPTARLSLAQGRRLIAYASTDGVRSAARKTSTRLRGRGQHASLSAVHFSATERLGASGRIEVGEFEGVALGALVEDQQGADLVTWHYELKVDEGEQAPVTTATSMAGGPGSFGKGAIGVIGAGAFARNVVLPALRAAGVPQIVVTDASPVRARQLSGTAGCASLEAPEELFTVQPDLAGVVIACAHSAHAAYATMGLQRRLPLLVEKPLALDRPDLDHVLALASETDCRLQVGHNRRYAPAFPTLRDAASRSSWTDVQMDIEAFPLHEFHWYRAPGEGHRIFGNLTHWLDLALGIADEWMPDEIRADRLDGEGLQVELRHRRMRTVIRMHDVGDRVVGGREDIVVRTPQETITVHDWARWKRESSTSSRVHRAFRHRGHNEEYAAWYRSIANGGGGYRSDLARQAEQSHRLALAVQERLGD